MTDKIYNVLFICTGNSARSIMAEGLLNELGNGRFKAYSAGSHPKGEVHPLALQTLDRLSVQQKSFRSKSWNKFAEPGAPELHFAITVCDNAAGEVCPVWPGQPTTAHWGVFDPAAVEGSEQWRLKAFNDEAHVLKRRIELMLALPPSSLTSLTIQRQLNDIGER